MISQLIIAIIVILSLTMVVVLMGSFFYLYRSYLQTGIYKCKENFNNLVSSFEINDLRRLYIRTSGKDDRNLIAKSISKFLNLRNNGFHSLKYDIEMSQKNYW